MAEPFDDKARELPSTEADRLRAAYAWARQIFSEDEALRTERDEGCVPMEQLLEELEEIYRQESLKRA
jgi:hypothetical protein